MSSINYSETIRQLVDNVLEEADKLIGSWKKDFDWLDEIVAAASESKGMAVIPKTPARKRKRQTTKDTNNSSENFVKNCEQEPVTIQNKENVSPEPKKKRISPAKSVRYAATPSSIKKKKSEMSKEVENREESPEIITIKGKSRKLSDSSPPSTRKKVKTDSSPPSTRKKVKTDKDGGFSNDPQKIVRTPDSKGKNSSSRSPLLPSRVEQDNTDDSCMLSKSPDSIKKKGKKVLCTPSKSSKTLNTKSPMDKYARTPDLYDSRNQSSINSSVMSNSRIRPIMNLSMKASKFPATPSPMKDNRLRVLQMKSMTSSASKSAYRHPPLSATSPLIGSKVLRTPSESNRIGNIATGMTSFVTRVQPTRPSKQDMEDAKKLEIAKRQEKEQRTLKKKEEIMKAKVEERKKKNEERMRKVQEIREAKEREANEARLAQERERRMREEEKARGEIERKKKLQALRREEEIAKAQKIKEEEDERKRKEEEKRRIIALHKEEERRKALQEEKKRIEYAKAKEIEIKKIKQITEAKVQVEKMNPETENKKTDPNATYTKASSPNKSSYDITPASRSSNYCIDDCRSDDSTDDEGQPKKEIPQWARGVALRQSLFDQQYFTGNINEIFPPEELLLDPDLDAIFEKKRTRFYQRTSSANWDTPLSRRNIC